MIKNAGADCRRMLVALLVLPIFVAFSAAPSFAEVALSFKETKWDFGDTGAMEKKAHDFQFKNSGVETIKIISLAPSCGCTAAVAGNPEIPPGESGAVKVVFDPSGLSGHHESTILVKTDSGADVALTVTADIKALGGKIDPAQNPPIVKITPMVVNLGKLKVGETKLYKVVVENAGEGELFLTNMGGTSDTGVPLFRKGIGKGKKVEITFFYKAEEKGAVRDFVVIETNDPAHKEVRIKLRGKVR